MQRMCVANRLVCLLVWLFVCSCVIVGVVQGDLCEVDENLLPTAAEHRGESIALLNYDEAVGYDRDIEIPRTRDAIAHLEYAFPIHCTVAQGEAGESFLLHLKFALEENPFPRTIVTIHTSFQLSYLESTDMEHRTSVANTALSASTMFLPLQAGWYIEKVIATMHLSFLDLTAVRGNAAVGERKNRFLGRLRMSAIIFSEDVLASCFHPLPANRLLSLETALDRSATMYSASPTLTALFDQFQSKLVLHPFYNGVKSYARGSFCFQGPLPSSKPYLCNETSNQLLVLTRDFPSRAVDDTTLGPQAGDVLMQFDLLIANSVFHRKEDKLWVKLCVFTVIENELTSPRREQERYWDTEDGACIHLDGAYFQSEIETPNSLVWKKSGILFSYIHVADSIKILHKIKQLRITLDMCNVEVVSLDAVRVYSHVDFGIERLKEATPQPRSCFPVPASQHHTSTSSVVLLPPPVDTQVVHPSRALQSTTGVGVARKRITVAVIVVGCIAALLVLLALFVWFGLHHRKVQHRNAGVASSTLIDQFAICIE